MNYIYQGYKAGRREPLELFIRCLSRQDRLENLPNGNLQWFSPALPPLKGGMALVYGGSTRRDWMSSETRTGLCIWTFNDIVNSVAVRDAISEFWVRDCLYVAVLEEQKYSTRGRSYVGGKDERNLKTGYLPMSTNAPVYQRYLPKRT